MEKILFKKLELWLVIIILMLLIPLSVVWGVKIAADRVFPWSLVNEVIMFVKGDENEDTSLTAKIATLFGGDHRFRVADQPESQSAPPEILLEKSVDHEMYQFGTSLNSGYYLIYGIFKLGEKNEPTAILLDTNGQIRRHWNFEFVGKSNLVRRLNYSPNGVLVSTSSNLLRAKDWCGNVMWQAEGDGFHHEIDYGNGVFTVWQNDLIVEVDEMTGEATQLLAMRDIVLSNPEIPLLRASLKNFKYFKTNRGKIFDNKGVRAEDTKKRNLLFNGDPFHQNSVTQNHGISPLFPDGSLLVSFRQNDFVGVLERDTGKVLWYETFNRQHDADWTPDGVVVYNNRTHFETSRIEYVSFDGEREMLIDENIFRWFRPVTGNGQLYPDGSVVFQGNPGEVYHLGSDKRIVSYFRSSLTVRNGYYMHQEEVERLEASCRQ